MPCIITLEGHSLGNNLKTSQCFEFWSDQKRAFKGGTLLRFESVLFTRLPPPPPHLLVHSAEADGEVWTQADLTAATELGDATK